MRRMLWCVLPLALLCGGPAEAVLEQEQSSRFFGHAPARLPRNNGNEVGEEDGTAQNGEEPSFLTGRQGECTCDNLDQCQYGDCPAGECGYCRGHTDITCCGNPTDCCGQSVDLTPLSESAPPARSMPGLHGPLVLLSAPPALHDGLPPVEVADGKALYCSPGYMGGCMECNKHSQCKVVAFQCYVCN